MKKKIVKHKYCGIKKEDFFVKVSAAVSPVWESIVEHDHYFFFTEKATFCRQINVFTYTECGYCRNSLSHYLAKIS